MLTSLPEIHICSEPLQCSSFTDTPSMFRIKYPVKNLQEAQTTFKEMVSEVRSLFPTVEQLIAIAIANKTYYTPYVVGKKTNRRRGLTV